jgi:hypothetical protein
VYEEIMERNQNSRSFVIFFAVLALTILSCSGLADLPGLGATATPTPTSTFTPSPTPTLTSTPTLTPTNTFTPTPLPETSIELLADGSTRFTDTKGGYTFVLPAGWLVINLAGDNPGQALDEAKSANPDKTLILNGLNSAVAQRARMGAADFSPDHFTALSAPMLFAVLDETTHLMPLKDLLEANRKMIPQILKAQVTASKIIENSSGVSYGILDVTLNITANSKTASVKEKLMMFQTDKYTVFITLAVLDELKEAGFAGFNAMIESVELLDP